MGRARMIKPGQLSNRWKWGLGALILIVCVIAVAALIGYSISQSKQSGYSNNTPVTDWGSSSAQGNVSARKLQQLPRPESREADALLARNDTPAWIVDLYTYQRDSALITTDLAAAWLQLLQQQLPHNVTAMKQKAETGEGAEQQAQDLDLQPFIRVAADVLQYLRFNRSKALLQLLREFATNGSFDPESVDPDQLQAEVQQLLNVQTLNAFYIATVRVDGDLSTGVSAAAQQPAALTGHHRMLLQATAQQRRQQARRRWHRMLLKQDELADQLLAQMQGAASAAPIPAAGSSSALTLRSTDATSSTAGSSSSASAAASAGASSTEATGADVSSSATATNVGLSSHIQTLQEMLCAAAAFSPSGLTGVLPNPDICPPQPQQRFSSGQLVFSPIKVPVVFHVLRFTSAIPAASFMSTDEPQAALGTTTGVAAFPPLWEDNLKAGQNLIDTANTLLKHTGIQFSLQEVRTDPTKYPYLVLPSKNAWLNCTHNQVAPAAGIQCLSRIASSPDVAPLATQGHVINVIVAGSDGSTDNTYCARTAAKPNPLCSTTSRGYTAAQGPWFLRAADPGWTQDSSQTNWVFLSWDSYDTAGTNTQARWNGGGATLAHELGHYFGLLHTHEGTPECLNGAQVGDAVADTPANKVVESWAAATGFVNLAGWCSDFRRGNHPPASQLGSFHSCPGVAADNLLNLMSYLPDACVMMLSPGQVTRMQWVVAKYRPKMMQACATQV